MTPLDSLVTRYGYFGIFSALVLGIVGLPLPDEVLLTYIGYNVYQGKMMYLLALVSSFLGTATGISHMDIRKFMIFAYSGAFLWSITFISLGYGLGERWFIVKEYIHHYGFYIFSFVILLILVIFAYISNRWR